jgi:CBS-domain-containing membrane protein
LEYSQTYSISAGEEHGVALLQRPLRELVRAATIVASPDESLRVVVYRMAEKGFTRMPVVDRVTGKFLGLVSLDDLLKARSRHLEEERRRERPLNLRFLMPGGKLSPTEKTGAQ